MVLEEQQLKEKLEIEQPPSLQQSKVEGLTCRFDVLIFLRMKGRGPN